MTGSYDIRGTWVRLGCFLTVMPLYSCDLKCIFIASIIFSSLQVFMDTLGANLAQNSTSPIGTEQSQFRRKNFSIMQRWVIFLFLFIDKVMLRLIAVKPTTGDRRNVRRSLWITARYTGRIFF